MRELKKNSSLKQFIYQLKKKKKIINHSGDPYILQFLVLLTISNEFTTESFKRLRDSSLSGIHFTVSIWNKDPWKNSKISVS